MLRSSASRSWTEYSSAGESQLAENAYRMRDDLDPGSYSAMLAAHWAARVPDKYKMDYKQFVEQHAVQHPRSRVPEPNYSVGTRGLPFIGQLPYDGEHRGGDDALY